MAEDAEEGRRVGKPALQGRGSKARKAGDEMKVAVVCRNYDDDRVLPRMGRYLRDALGWELVRKWPRGAWDAVYFLGYFEWQKADPHPGPLPGREREIMRAAYFTHREEEPPGNAKARLFDRVARVADLRVVMCELYGREVESFGPTIQPPLPVELGRFVPAGGLDHGRHGRGTRKGTRKVVGLAGFTYSNHRKGEDLVQGIISSPVGQTVEWRASGRGWPVRTRRYSWLEMPEFYQSLDVLVCPSRVEGGPMPVLEALACGVQVVVPAGVGIIDELADVRGIWRYERGDLRSMERALDEAVKGLGRDESRPYGEALREAVAGHSVEAFCEAHRLGFERLLDEGLDAGMLEMFTAEDAEGLEREGRERKAEDAEGGGDLEYEGRERSGRRWNPLPDRPETAGWETRPTRRGTGSRRGIYCVAFGEPARECAGVMMESAKRHMPDVPIALCAASKIGPEDVLLVEEDADVGARRAKLRAYELAPAEWEAVLYLDADTEVIAPIYRFFEWVEDGWEFVIAKDPHLMDTLHSFERRNNGAEMVETVARLGSKMTLQWNGGVWAFARNERVARFFERWQEEWEVHAQRDQGALVRAMYAEPLRIWLVGNEWNCFPKYSRGIVPAGLMHYPGRARRWKGLIPGRIDSKAAWKMVEEFEGRERGRRGGAR